MNLFQRAFGSSPSKRKSGGKSRGNSGRRSSRRTPARKGSGRVAPWLIAGAVVVIVAGVGLVKWSQTGPGQATLLSLGSDKMYADVQATVESALTEALPGFRPGSADAAGARPDGDGGDHDWPAPAFGPGAAVRCRAVPVKDGTSWWDVQARVAGAVRAHGGRVLWGERLYPTGRLPQDQVKPNEAKDMLRLDVGVPGRPTHTLVLYRAGRRPELTWGGGPGQAAWSRLAADQGPVVALLIDDWGYSKSEAARTILALPAPVTLAVLPGLPYSRHFALKGTDLILPPGGLLSGNRAGNRDEERADSSLSRRLDLGCFVEVGFGSGKVEYPVKRREVFLHLPMEPQGYPDPDPGPRAVMVGMDETAIGERLDEALAALPSITGVNNHMGSAATSDQATMEALMKALRSRDLLFVDSLTSSRSVAFAEAQKAGLPTARNRIFLDYDNENREAIKSNLEVLVRSARSSGFALGIGHPHRTTADVLSQEIPRLVKQGVRFVTVSEMMALRDRMQSARAGG